MPTAATAIDEAINVYGLEVSNWRGISFSEPTVISNQYDSSKLPVTPPAVVVPRITEYSPPVT